MTLHLTAEDEGLFSEKIPPTRRANARHSEVHIETTQAILTQIKDLKINIQGLGVCVGEHQRFSASFAKVGFGVG